MARVLIADDDPDTCGFVRRLVRKAVVEAEVEIASNGAEAFDWLMTTSFDLALLDLYMPGMTGLQVTRVVRRRGVRTQIVLLTGWATVEVAREAVRAGVQDLQEKPIIAPSLLRVVRTFLVSPEPERRPRPIRSMAMSEGRIVSRRS